MNKKQRSNLLGIILAFLLSVVLFLILLIGCIHTTLFSEHYALKTMEKSGYYTQLQEEISNEIIALGAAGGVEEDLLDSSLYVNLQRDCENKVRRSFSGSNADIDTSEFRTLITERVNQAAERKNVYITEEVQNAMDRLIDACVSVYDTKINLLFFTVMAPAIEKVDRYLYIGEAFLVIMALLIALLMSLSQRYKHRAYRTYIYALSGTFLMLGAIPIYMYASKLIERVYITTKSFYDFIVLWLNGVVMRFVILDLIILIVMGILVYLYQKSIPFKRRLK